MIGELQWHLMAVNTTGAKCLHNLPMLQVSFVSFTSNSKSSQLLTIHFLLQILHNGILTNISPY